MKVVILAGGLGTRISEETNIKPKPMVEIGGMPILWHIMKIYSHYGFNDFIICLGYKGYQIKEWFNNHYLRYNDVTLDLEKNTAIFHKGHSEKWKVTLVDTGDASMTGGRLNRVKDYVGNETFMMTYGDGVTDMNINELVEFHKSHGDIATVTTVTPEGRFGVVHTDQKNDKVTSFQEKHDNKNKISAGFFVLEPKIFDYLTEGDATVFETDALIKLVSDRGLRAFPHDGFWKPMDTLSDKAKLESMWEKGNAPWKLWD
ncbi:MAG: glucose-1-phosphate cytidylyltransferase [bacterium]